VLFRSFAQGVQLSLFAIFSTHPPLAERIRRLEPEFRGEFPEVPGDFLAPLDEEIPVVAAGFAPVATAAGIVVPEEITARVGTISAEGLAYASVLLKALPPDLFQKARTAPGARAILLGLLLDARPEIRAIQKPLLGLEPGATPSAAVESLLPALDALDLRLRLPLADLAVFALRTLTAPAARGFMNEVEALASADGRVSIFEFMLATMLRRRLQPIFGPPPRGTWRPDRGQGLLMACTVILSAFARAASEKQGVIRRTYDRGREELCGPERIRAALERASQAPPQAKKRLLVSLARMAEVDGIITVAEAELLRTVADGIGCPVPPIVAT
jgi:hypothetical protein